jgi:hypothetical protein
MIKKINLLLAGAVCCCVAVLSCSKSNEADLSNPGNGNGGTGTGTTCDTVNMQYTANVLPIIRSNCYGCHGNGAASGGVSLDSYDKLKTQAASGKLLAVITHAAGVPPMPQGGKLSECDINKIRSWINRGILNN